MIHSKSKFVNWKFIMFLIFSYQNHNRAPLSSSFHRSGLGFILCNIVKLHHQQLILSLWHYELDASQENCETLENDGVSFSFIEWLCALEHTWMRVTIARETMCIGVFWGDYVHWNSRQNVRSHAFECAKVAMCIDLLSPCWHFLACHWCLCASRVW
jgi:hypothetical protein